MIPAEPLTTAAVTKLIGFAIAKLSEAVKNKEGVLDKIDQARQISKSIQLQHDAAEQLQRVDPTMRDYLQEIRFLGYDFEDLLNKWLIAYSSAHRRNTKNKGGAYSHWLYPHSWFIRSTHWPKIGGKMKEIEARLEKTRRNLKVLQNDPRCRTTKVQPMRPEVGPVVNKFDIPGRDRDKDDLVRKLVSHDWGVPVISITGSTSSGKTALAQSVLDDGVVQTYFDQIIWVPVSYPIDNDNRMRLAKTIIKEIEKKDHDYFEWNAMRDHLIDCLTGHRFLLVLDNVSVVDSSTWKDLKLSLGVGAAGSRVLVTSELRNVGTMMDSSIPSHHLNQLNSEDRWLLLRDLTMSGRRKEDVKKLESHVKELAKKCDGLLLSVISLAYFMRDKVTEQEWKDVLEHDVWNVTVINKDLLPAQVFSYLTMNHDLRRCFEYFAFLPNDYPINKDIMIKRWMAHGFLDKDDDQMEKTGEDYFNSLVALSFLQDIKQGGNDDATYKLNHHAHVLARFLSENECHFEENSTSTRGGNIISLSGIRHSTVIFRDDNIDFIPLSLYQVKKLRTLKLLMRRWKPLAEIPPDVFCKFLHLRALDLHGTGLKKLSSKIKNLKHLRFLDVSGSDLQHLPDTLCSLKDLETFIFNESKKLGRLPQGIGELDMLRHLVFQDTPLRYLPKGIGRLTALRTLSTFIVAAARSRKGAKIGELKDLNLLQGHIEIKGLNRVKRGSDAKKAELEKKRDLRSLCLNFGPDTLGIPQAVKNMEDVLEALKPNKRLEKLEILNFLGSKFPTWMITLKKLRVLTLTDCKNCSQLPPLGNNVSVHIQVSL